MSSKYQQKSIQFTKWVKKWPKIWRIESCYTQGTYRLSISGSEWHDTEVNKQKTCNQISSTSLQIGSIFAYASTLNTQIWTKFMAKLFLGHRQYNVSTNYTHKILLNETSKVKTRHFLIIIYDFLLCITLETFTKQKSKYISSSNRRGKKSFLLSQPFRPPLPLSLM